MTIYYRNTLFDKALLRYIGLPNEKLQQYTWGAIVCIRI